MTDIRRNTLRPTSLGHLVRQACELDVQALKPGNVSIYSPGHGMSAEDFLRSAAAIAVPITAPGFSVGERIFRAVEATQTVVSCNTNLGIILLLAPLIQAAMLSVRQLRDNLALLLLGLNQSDADWAYRAIRLAKPGGMGNAVRHDIAEPPQITLREAMREAASRDQIAALYVSDYRLLFERGLPTWFRAMQQWASPQWATTAVFLEYLANAPDSLITRKFGAAQSQRVSDAARSFHEKIQLAQDPSQMRGLLTTWDQELKQAGLNPGTTADMTVATVFLASLQDMR